MEVPRRCRRAWGGRARSFARRGAAAGTLLLRLARGRVPPWGRRRIHSRRRRRPPPPPHASVPCVPPPLRPRDVLPVEVVEERVHALLLAWGTRCPQQTLANERSGRRGSLRLPLSAHGHLVRALHLLVRRLRNARGLLGAHHLGFHCTRLKKKTFGIPFLKDVLCSVRLQAQHLCLPTRRLR